MPNLDPWIYINIKIKLTSVLNIFKREKMKVKEDALSHLSDQILVLNERIQQLEKKTDKLELGFFVFIKNRSSLFLKLFVDL